MSGHFLVIGSVVSGAWLKNYLCVGLRKKIPVMAVVVVEVVVEMAGVVSFSDTL